MSGEHIRPPEADPVSIINNRAIASLLNLSNDNFPRIGRVSNILRLVPAAIFIMATKDT